MATTTRYYLTAKIGTGVSGDPCRPQFFVDTEGLSWLSDSLACTDYGGEATYMVTAKVTLAEHSKLSKTPGVTVIVPGPVAPVALDAPVGDYAEVLWDRLEAHGFPALWIEPETTYRAVLRHLMQCIRLAQGMQRFGVLFPPGVTLDTHLLSLGPAQVQLMTDAVNAAGGRADMLVPAHTLRTAITLLAQQLPYPAALLDVAL